MSFCIVIPSKRSAYGPMTLVAAKRQSEDLSTLGIECSVFKLHSLLEEVDNVAGAVTNGDSPEWTL